MTLNFLKITVYLLSIKKNVSSQLQLQCSLKLKKLSQTLLFVLGQILQQNQLLNFFLDTYSIKFIDHFMLRT